MLYQTIFVVRSRVVSEVNLAHAKAHLSALVAKAEGGETVCITRRGRPVARLVAAVAPRRPIDTARLKAFTDTLAPQRQSTGTFIREMRADSRY